MQYNINSLLYRKDELKAYSLLSEIKYFIDVLPLWKEKADHWVIAHPVKSLRVLDKGNITKNAIDYVQSLIDNDKPIYIVLADEFEDDSILTILYRNTPVISQARYILSLTIISLKYENSCSTFIQVLNDMLKYPAWEFRYIRVETEQYSFNQRAVFDDRLPLGWMLYLPELIKSEDTPSAYKIIYAENVSGSIIISKENFNGEDYNDIAISNNIEIELASNGFLPLLIGL